MNFRKLYATFYPRNELIIKTTLKLTKMKHFNWKKSYETGIAEIDRQHKKLFEIANDYYDTLFSETFTSDNKEMLSILDDLKAYAEFHYNFERKIYPTEIVQRYFIIENMLIERIDELKVLYKSDNIVVLYGFAEFLRKWLLKHILILNTSDFKKILKREVLDL